MELPQGLTERLGPLPVWQWVLLGGMGVAALAYLRRKKAPAGPLILQPATAGAGGFAGTSGNGATGETSGTSPTPVVPAAGTPQNGSNFQPNGGLPLCTPGLGATCIVGAGFLPGHPDVPFFANDQTGDWVASYVAGGPPGWPTSAAQVFQRLGLGRPAQLPVTDAYGNVGPQTQAAAAAGGYWGAGGTWVPTATPWFQVPGSPPAGSGQPVPYTTTTAAQAIPTTGSIPATPAQPQFGGIALGQFQAPGLYDVAHRDLGALSSAGQFLQGGWAI